MFLSCATPLDYAPFLSSLSQPQMDGKKTTPKQQILVDPVDLSTTSTPEQPLGPGAVASCPRKAIPALGRVLLLLAAPSTRRFGVFWGGLCVYTGLCTVEWPRCGCHIPSSPQTPPVPPQLPSPAPEGRELATKQLNIHSWSNGVKTKCVPQVFAVGSAFPADTGDEKGKDTWRGVIRGAAPQPGLTAES